MESPAAAETHGRKSRVVETNSKDVFLEILEEKRSIVSVLFGTRASTVLPARRR